MITQSIHARLQCTATTRGNYHASNHYGTHHSWHHTHVDSARALAIGAVEDSARAARIAASISERVSENPLSPSFVVFLARKLMASKRRKIEDDDDDDEPPSV